MYIGCRDVAAADFTETPLREEFLLVIGCIQAQACAPMLGVMLKKTFIRAICIQVLDTGVVHGRCHRLQPEASCGQIRRSVDTATSLAEPRGGYGSHIVV